MILALVFPINEDPHSLAEVREAILIVDEGKGSGVCGIPVRLLNDGGEHMAHGSHAVLTTIW